MYFLLFSLVSSLPLLENLSPESVEALNGKTPVSCFMEPKCSNPCGPSQVCKITPATAFDCGSASCVPATGDGAIGQAGISGQQQPLKGNTLPGNTLPSKKIPKSNQDVPSTGYLPFAGVLSSADPLGVEKSVHSPHDCKDKQLPGQKNNDIPLSPELNKKVLEELNRKF